MLDAFGERCLNLVVLVVYSIGLFWYFLYFGCMLTKTTVTSEKLASTLPKDGCVGPPTSSKKDFSVVILPVTAERERVSFFDEMVPSFFFAHALPLFPVMCFWGSLHFFIFISNLILIFFFYLLHIHTPLITLLT